MHAGFSGCVGPVQNWTNPDLLGRNLTSASVQKWPILWLILRIYQLGLLALINYIIFNPSECLGCVYVCAVRMVVVEFKGSIRGKQTYKTLEGPALIAWFRLSLP